MGYTYDSSGLLCCDICGNSGNVKRYKCPFGWCQPIAACPHCRKEKAVYFSKKHHREAGCEKASAEFHERERTKYLLLQDGEWIRCSALRVDKDNG